MDEDRSAVAYLCASAMPHLIKINPRARLIIVGGGNDFERLSAHVEKINSEIGENIITTTGARVDINKFFGFHFAVFGNTGSGKSNTIATIVQKIIGDTKKVARNAKIVVVDSNGEYKAAFETLTNRELSISTKFLDADADFEDEGS
jgi:DNA helicase HerA-like ATPase